MRFTIALLVLLSTACAGVTPRVHSRSATLVDENGTLWTNHRCFDLLNAGDNWTAASKFLVGFGGTSALTTPISGELTDDPKVAKQVEWGMGISSAILSAAGLAALWMGDAKQEEFSRYCNVDPSTPVEHPAADEEPRAEGARSGSPEPEFEAVDAGQPEE